MPLPVRAEDRKLDAEIERLLYQVDVIVQEAEGLVEKLNVEQFNWSPAKGRWSMAENFDHLNVTNGLMMAAFSAAVTKARAEGRLGTGPYTYGFLSRWFYRNIQPPVRGRYSAPKKFQPQPKQGRPAEPGEVMEEFRTSHERLKQLIVSADGVDLAAVKVVSPVSSLFKYELGMGFWIMCGHDRRHLWQARNVRNHVEFPK